MSHQHSPWTRVVEFHGHICPGLAVGYRVAQVALRELGVTRAADEELVAIVENDACGVDAGKGNLIYRDYGKHAYTFARRGDAEALRIAVNTDAWPRDPEYTALRDKVFAGTAAPEEEEAFQQKRGEVVAAILEGPEEQFCRMTRVREALPERARIFPSVTSAVCGESVMEPRARIRQGRIVCIPCAGEYTWGW